MPAEAVTFPFWATFLIRPLLSRPTGRSPSGKGRRKSGARWPGRGHGQPRQSTAAPTTDSSQGSSPPITHFMRKLSATLVPEHDTVTLANDSGPRPESAGETSLRKSDDGQSDPGATRPRRRPRSCREALGGVGQPVVCPFNDHWPTYAPASPAPCPWREVAPVPQEPTKF